ncbi:hypothetical protein V6Z12_D05G159500 [Gossypium hirsutum]
MQKGLSILCCFSSKSCKVFKRRSYLELSFFVSNR